MVKLVLKLIMQSYVMASEPACARSAMVALVVEPLAAALVEEVGVHAYDAGR